MPGKINCSELWSVDLLNKSGLWVNTLSASNLKSILSILYFQNLSQSWPHWRSVLSLPTVFRVFRIVISIECLLTRLGTVQGILYALSHLISQQPCEVGPLTVLILLIRKEVKQLISPTPSLGTSICHGCSPPLQRHKQRNRCRKRKKKKKKPGLAY